MEQQTAAELESAVNTRRYSPAATRLRRQYSKEVHRNVGGAATLGEVVFMLSSYIALLVLAAVGNWMLLQKSAWMGWALYPLTLFFIGTRFRAIGNMIHEACHGMLVRGKRLNAVLGHFLAILDFTSLEPYTEEHFTHHSHLGNKEKDLDFKPRQRFGFANPKLDFFWMHVLRPLTLFHVPFFVKPIFFRRKDPVLANVGRVLYLATLAFIASRVGLKAFALFYLVPYLTAYQIIRYWSDAVDHAGIIGSEDEFYRSRNHILPLNLLNRIVFPRNDEYHLTHHLFPSVPVRYQPIVHQILMQDPEYAERQTSFKQFIAH